jgi:hypothetical protein
MSKELLTIEQTIDYAKKYGYKSIAEVKPTLEIILIKDWLRTKHKIHIGNDQDERGSMNHKTEEYFCCEITRREPNPHKPGRKYIRKQCYQTYSKYEDAVKNGIIWSLDFLFPNSLQLFLDELYDTNYSGMNKKVSTTTE